MSKKILLLHGWGGSDSPHWQSWLASEIAKGYGKVSFLKFSDFDTPKLDVWLDELTKELADFQPDIVICHSLANSLWFHLEKSCKIRPLEYLYLVAPPSFQCKVDALNEFFPLQYPSSLSAQHTLLITSTNDPYMQEEEAIELQKNLNIEMKVLKNAGHINTDSGFGEWPWFLKELKQKL